MKLLSGFTSYYNQEKHMVKITIQVYFLQLDKAKDSKDIQKHGFLQEKD